MTYTKAERRRWWRRLTDDQRQAHIAKKIAEKAKRPARESNCPVYPVVDDSSREEWLAGIRMKNPWLAEAG